MPVSRKDSTRVCADCGATEDLYFHEMDQSWVCEEVADCILKQKDDAVDEAHRLRQAVGKAASALDVAERDPKAAYRASLWLRTGYSLDHPNYLTPEQAEEFSRA